MGWASFSAGFARAALVLLVALAAEVALAQGRVHFVGVAGWDEHVFGSELSGAQRAVASAFGPLASSTTLSNAGGQRVTAGSLTATLRATAQRMREGDVLFLFMTSHGDPGRGVALRQGSIYGHLPPGAVRAAMGAAGVRSAVIVVSACFSGVYTALANANTLVVTASRRDRSSFGCRPGNAWTFFGRAFFAESMRSGRTIPQAFASARALVARWERAERLPPSEPQMAGGRQVMGLLARRG